MKDRICIFPAALTLAGNRTNFMLAHLINLFQTAARAFFIHALASVTLYSCFSPAYG